MVNDNQGASELALELVSVRRENSMNWDRKRPEQTTLETKRPKKKTTRVNLTDAEIAALPTPAKSHSLYFMSGLALEVRSTGAKVWISRLQKKGQPDDRAELGFSEAVTVDTAKRLHAERRRRYNAETPTAGEIRMSSGPSDNDERWLQTVIETVAKQFNKGESETVPSIAITRAGLHTLIRVDPGTFPHVTRLLNALIGAKG